MKGRKRKPNHLHLVDKTYRKDRHGPAETAASAAPMEDPGWLPASAPSYFETIRQLLAATGLDSEDYQAIAALTALRLDETVRLTRHLERRGRVYTTTGRGGKMVRARPEVAMRNEALRHLHALLSELGLTPVARSKVTAGAAAGKANPFEEL